MTIHWKAVEQYFTVVLFVNPLTPRVKPWVIQSFLTFDSMDRTVKCDHSLESCCAVHVLYCRAVTCNFGKFINFRLGTFRSERVYLELASPSTIRSRNLIAYCFTVYTVYCKLIGWATCTMLLKWSEYLTCLDNLHEPCLYHPRGALSLHTVCQILLDLNANLPQPAKYDKWIKSTGSPCFYISCLPLDAFRSFNLGCFLKMMFDIKL